MYPSVKTCDDIVKASVKGNDRLLHVGYVKVVNMTRPNGFICSEQHEGDIVR